MQRWAVWKPLGGCILPSRARLTYRQSRRSAAVTGGQGQAIKQVLGLQRLHWATPLTASVTTTLPQGSVPCNSGSHLIHSYANSHRHSALDSEGADKAQAYCWLESSSRALASTPACPLEKDIQMSLSSGQDLSASWQGGQLTAPEAPETRQKHEERLLQDSASAH